MPSDTKVTIKIKVSIHPGPASLVQLALDKRFWSKVISTVNDEVRREQQRDEKPEDAIKRLNGGDKEVAHFD